MYRPSGEDPVFFGDLLVWNNVQHAIEPAVALEIVLRVARGDLDKEGLDGGGIIDGAEVADGTDPTDDIPGGAPLR